MENLLENISNGNIEKNIRLSPVLYKLIFWNQNSKFIEPINIDCSGLTLEQAQENICSFVANNDLLRTKVNDVFDICVMEMTDGLFPVYQLKRPGEKKIILFKMAREMLNKPIWKRLLYDGAFFVYDNTIEFSGLFHHLICDGVVMTTVNKRGIDLKYYNYDYKDYEDYFNRLYGKCLVDFQEYALLKSKLVKEFYCEEMVYLHYTVKRKNRICNRNMTLEEFWACVLSLYIKKVFNMKRIPLHIVSGGRMIGETLITSMGDYHDDFIFVIDDEEEFIDNFRYYKNRPYLNAEQYKNELFQKLEYRESLEPITLCLKWKTKELGEFRKNKLLLPNHAKKHILGFEVLLNQNIKEVQINFGVSQKIKNMIEGSITEFYQIIDSVLMW